MTAEGFFRFIKGKTVKGRLTVILYVMESVMGVNAHGIESMKKN